jgi:hypothetical protein
MGININDLARLYTGGNLLDLASVNPRMAGTRATRLRFF